MTQPPDYIHWHPAALAAEATSLWHQVQRQARFAVGQLVHVLDLYQLSGDKKEWRVLPLKVANADAEAVCGFVFGVPYFAGVGDVFLTEQLANAEIERRQTK